MNEDFDSKVISIFKKHNQDLPTDTDEKIKFFAGFNYVKLKRDENGNKFNEQSLLSFAQKTRYIVRIMRKIDGEICLYNYDISNDELVELIKAVDNNVLMGKIIAIDKYFPEDLA